VDSQIEWTVRYLDRVKLILKLMMGLFSYMYIQSFVENGGGTVGHVFQQAIALLTPAQQVELYHALGDYLLGQNVLPLAAPIAS
jgi:hypothetical protein